jgi:DNA uptake protein ComE-like DNA-binding protein
MVVITLLAGSAVGAYLHYYPQSKSSNQTTNLFDYTDSDRKFKSYSATPPEKVQDDISGIRAINSLTEEELIALPTIGTVIARRIIDFLYRNGPLKSVEALLSVPGIGPRRLEIIKQYLHDSSGVKK